MIHPATRLKYINDTVGYGVFATDFIPKGTITYVKDPLELEITSELFDEYNQEMQDQIEKYSYRDEKGTYILSWDFGKYVNHCCNCNTMSTGYGFEIAIRDIHPGEEITDEYGLFNMDGELELTCKEANCRMKVCGTDILLYFAQWDEKVRSALGSLKSIPQPLMHLLDPKIQSDLTLFLEHGQQYRSITALQFVDERAERSFRQ